MGIGSEGWVAVKTGRNFVGVELKKSYFDVAVGNLIGIEESLKSELLLDV
jgi:DNA modification methylase